MLLSGHRYRGRGILALLLVLLTPMSGRGQEGDERPSLAVSPGGGAVELLLGDVLADPSLEEALSSGLPLRVRARIELWRDGFFDDLEATFAWRMNLIPDPLSGGVRVVGEGPPPLDLTAAGPREARASIIDRIPIPLAPGREGRFYYLGWIEVETLSLSDLGELRRWLRGELGPAVGSGEPVEDAFEDGLGRILVRALGLPTRRIRVRSNTFEFDGPAPGPS